MMFTRRAGIRFGLILAAFAGITWLIFRDEVMGPVLVPLRMLTAQGALTFIRLAGMEAIREGAAVYHPAGFAYEISRGCTGLVGLGLLVVAILAYPSARSHRLLGIALCVPALIGLNLARLVHLFYLGVYRPEVFHVAHEIVWQAVMAVGVFVLWLGWTIWAHRADAALRRPPPSSSPLRGEYVPALGNLGS